MVADQLIALFPEHYHQKLKMLSNDWNDIEEIRVRINRPLEIIKQATYKMFEDMVVNELDGQFILNQLSEYSRYRLEEELRNGYITIAGGHRVGITGKTVLQHGAVKQIQSISSFNIRVAKQKMGCANQMIKHIKANFSYYNTLVIGPPQSGKTTLLRDLSRLIGNGWGNSAAMKVGIIDERSEIAGCKNGIPNYQIGLRTDILDGCPKKEGMMMMIRSMSPDVLIVDEIGSQDDCFAIQEAIRSGVSVICSAHSDSYINLKKRKPLRSLLEQQYFDRFILLGRHQRNQTQVLNSKGQVIEMNRGDNNELDWSNTLDKRLFLDRI
ncbi:stage III sporulation protein AA [Amphibacillus jilinensis]|uniref:stage III sporulation protein AA n=1 Tax=Amphibacillus jilinensis TaxID=1216008 RepID=UPI000315CC56|nr:stage III sporulation protein AA [Amphibacillus jilinensis]